ncbi:hypothetical protein ACQEVC_34015 [Plantactinospora sp. CA-294935]|uniref:hypothetical protein n=1 Tax=Plantactinospora sp. CA-294935 TaxID=3240012 RepID=UPI003D94BEB8
MSRGLRSARRVVGHERGRPYSAGRTVPPPAPPVRRDWGALDQQPTLPPVDAPRPAPLGRAQRRSLRRRACAWRLLLGGWFAFTVLVLYLGVRWFGIASVCCHLVTVAVLFALAWCASVDLRDQEREMRDGR